MYKHVLFKCIKSKKLHLNFTYAFMLLLSYKPINSIVLVINPFATSNTLKNEKITYYVSFSPIKTTKKRRRAKNLMFTKCIETVSYLY